MTARLKRSLTAATLVAALAVPAAEPAGAATRSKTRAAAKRDCRCGLTTTLRVSGRGLPRPQTRGVDAEHDAPAVVPDWYLPRRWAGQGVVR